MPEIEPIPTPAPAQSAVSEIDNLKAQIEELKALKELIPTVNALLAESKQAKELQLLGNIQNQLRAAGNVLPEFIENAEVVKKTVKFDNTGKVNLEELKKTMPYVFNKAENTYFGNGQSANKQMTLAEAMERVNPGSSKFLTNKGGI